MGEVGQETVDFAALVGRAAEESYVSLKELVEKSKSSESLPDSEKKIMILKYIVKTQQRMLRLNVLAKWCQQVPLIQYCQQLASTLSSHETCFTQAADSMFFMHEGLQQARAPIYDVPSAIEILLGGTYQRLPKCIEDVGTQSTLNEDQQGPALKKLETLVRSKLLEISLPKEITEIKVYDGVVSLRVDGEFKVLVTLGYRGHLSMWRILHLELLVGERSGPVKLEESRRHVLGDDLERRMAASENPFMILYSILHELCVALIMDTVIRQVQALRQGRWRDAIRFELISDGTSGQGANVVSTHSTQDGEIDSAGLRTPGVKVIYWLDLDKSTGTSDAGAAPFLKVEPGPDLQIKCLHSTFVIDPLSDKEAEFNLNPSCIDVEMLLLRAIDCNRYTRLLEIYKEVEKNGQINRTSGDVQLQFNLDDYEKRDSSFDLQKHDGQETLLVRAYGSSFFTLGINIRNGRFLLRSSKNIISSKALLECEEALNQGSITAIKAFINLRRYSILHLFACIGRFLGLEVFEHGFTPVKLPKNISDDSNSLIMGFPECGSSYFLLMQLDREFKPCPKLVEAQLDSPGKAEPFGDVSKVTRVKDLDISHMHMCQDELNLSLLDRKVPFILNDGNINETRERGLPSSSSLEGSTLCSSLPLSFSSIVDEAFELEKGSNVQSVSSASVLSSASHFGLGTMNFHGVKPSISSPVWEGAQTSQNGTSSFKSSLKSGSTNSLSTTLVKNQAVKKLIASKSDQDLSALKSPQSGGFGSYGMLNEDQLTVSGLPSARLLSSPQHTGSPVSVANVNANELKSLAGGSVSVSFAVSGSNAWVASPTSSTLDSAVLENSNQETVPQHDGSPRKRSVADMMRSLPSLHCLEVNNASYKRRKIQRVPHAQLPPTQSLISRDHPSKTEGHNFANLIAEANKGNASPSVYVSALLHIVRHCSLCIKHARLISQMEALDIPFVEEVGLRSASSNLWFRLPFSRGDTWQYICLRLGRPGSLYWDVKIIDPHYKDLWELQKGCNTTPWGSGVRIANTSDVDSHIHYDSEGVVLSYNSVEADSIKKLVADVQRLSNARTFALKMRKLLGPRIDEKLDENDASLDNKAPAGLKTVMEGSEKLSGQMRRAFRIEAVGLMSVWFSFGSGVLARFVVEWESGKEGCRMHVTPDQLWPHTKFLEDFINGGEVASLLDCIRLTAGPLHALAAATRPARAAPVSGVPGITASISSTLKQAGNLPSQGLISNSNTNPIQASSGPGGNPSAPTPSGPIGTHSTAAVLAAAAAAAAAAGRGGPGIVPSSLLPIDVSVVLRGPYWIRIIYRKNFAVDMRCFAGDQVWLQPATPPKVGQPVGGSLPCPQFRPFIMEHVAQELNGIDSNFPAAQQALGMSNSNNPNPSSAPQLPGTAGNRANPNAGAMSRTGNGIASLNRIGNALPGSSNLPGATPLRRLPGSGVPAHVRGELNTAIIGLGDDGGYGGGWVPLVALKKVLRGILKYLGVLWLFAQLPDLLKEILGSILKDNEGALLNLDQEQPALRFFVGGYVFAVSVHRVQLLLQVLSVKRFHHSQQQQQNPAGAQEELTQSEIGEICDYFSRRVASEPYDASRVASFITLLTLPISVLREFLKLIAWKKGLGHGQGADPAPQKSRIELCLENHMGFNRDGVSENSSVSKSNIYYDRAHNSVDFALTVVLDPAHIPHVNAAGGGAWLPYCVSVRLRYSFGENPIVSYLGMEGSHGGRACWLRADDWDKCKQRVARNVEMNGSSGGDSNQGRLRVVADSVQRTLHACLQGLKDGIGGI
ncbi:mediator of RNA polymerase ii transcription subunit 14 [Phtheirospermum japonicum]|uniref:Mediator of RNA polymerase II transcription subunit 14 n=1 Tax=Phtheirospermum japonicum TaxID=374723 RepID=A0A830D088_9LAMI|nr:mediator of RNA polymerase ii transcription subunit 14 [Phtheirospermum japonicum]